MLRNTFSMILIIALITCLITAHKMNPHKPADMLDPIKLRPFMFT